MVIVSIKGGLGNQLFQYAAGRRLAHVLGVELKLDISWFRKNKHRSYLLSGLTIEEKIASKRETIALRGRYGVIERITKKLFPHYPKPPGSFITEKQFRFDPEILTLTDGVYLDGYWQSEKYFIDIEPIIRKEFVPREPQSGKNKEVATKILSSESISISIRRGDYISDPVVNKVHGVCDIDYYLRCINRLSETINEPHFFVFSDEPDWAKDNLKLNFPMTIVYHNHPDKPHEDLRLISQCKHHIIANSSFSWWGAWLNPDKGKKVLAPQKWFRDATKDTSTLIPSDWMSL